MIKLASHIKKWDSRCLGLASALMLFLFLTIANPAMAQQKISLEATTRLFESIAENNLQAVKINTAGGADLSAVNKNGMTPIDLAIDSGHFDIVYYLLAYRDTHTKKQPANPPAQIKQKTSPRPAAVASGTQPPPAVAGIYTPPVAAPSLSTRMVTSDPPITKSSPSPFDPKSRPPGSGLTIIGDIRGPELPTDKTEITTQIEPEIVSAPIKQAVAPLPTTEEPTQVSAFRPTEPPLRKPLAPARKILNASNTPSPKTPPVPKPDAIVRVTKIVKAPAAFASGTQPAPAVASTYTSPAKSPALSPRVFTSRPPTTEPSPSPFNPKSRPPGSGLAIIGDIQGPELPTDKSEITTRLEPEIASAPIKQTDTPLPTTEEPTQIPAFRLTESPFKKPLPQAQNILNTSNTPSPKASPVPKPEVIVQVTKTVKAPAAAKSAQVTHDKPAALLVRKPIPIETTLPEKPKDDRSFFEKIKSAFSLDNDTSQSRSAATKRVVMDIPPRQSDLSAEVDNGWAVRKVEKAVPDTGLSNQLASKPSVTPLPGIPLSLANDKVLGLPAPVRNSAEFKKSCIDKKSGAVTFCLLGLRWPDDIAGLFAASTVLYSGTKSIIRYDEGAATFYQTLFPTKSFAAIVDHFTRQYGPPTRMIKRSIAPLASPRVASPTAIWDSLSPKTKLVTTLEIRTFDDTRGGFPDSRRGVALLYHKWSRPIFPHVSTVELMMLSANQQH